MFTGWACAALLRADARALLVGGLGWNLGGGVGLPRAFLWPSGACLSSALRRPARELLSVATPRGASVCDRRSAAWLSGGLVQFDMNPHDSVVIASRRLFSRCYCGVSAR